MNFLESFSKYHKFIILSGICLALLSLIDKTLAVGTIFTVFLASVVLFLIGKIKEKETVRFLSALFVIVFLIHVVMVVFVYYANFQPFSNGRGDFKEYNFVAQEIAKRVPSGNFSLKGLPLAHYYPVIVGYIYILTVPSMFLGELFNAFIVALVSVFIFLIVCQMGRSKKEGFIVGLIAGFYPSLAFYGSLLLKDALVVLLSMISLLLILKIIKNFSWLHFLVFYIALIGVIHLRFYIGYALILDFVICWLLLSDLKIKKRIIYAVIMIVLFGFLPRIAPLDGKLWGYMGLGTFKYYLNTETIISYRQLAQPSIQSPNLTQTQTQKDVRTQPETQPQIPGITPPLPDVKDSDGNFSVSVDTNLDNPVSFLKSTSLPLIYSIFGPLPWQLTQKRHLFTLIEMIPWYFLLFFIVRGVTKYIKKEYRAILPVIIFSIIVFGVLSFFMNNFGIVTRIRMPAFSALLCLLPFGFEKFTQLNNFYLKVKIKIQRILFNRVRKIKIPFLEKYLNQ